MRIFYFSILFLLVVSQTAFAVSPLPKERVFIEPVNAEVGAPVVVSAFLYNDQKETITFTIEAKAGDTIIGKSVTTLAKESAKTINFSWEQPSKQVNVSVNIVSALTSKKNDLVALHGSLGILLVGPKEESAITDKPAPAGMVGSLFSDIKKKIEDFRTKQISYFQIERGKAQEKLNKKDVILPSTTEEETIEISKVGNPIDYVFFVLLTAALALFSNVYMFYGLLILLAFLFVRLIFRSFI